MARLEWALTIVVTAGVLAPIAAPKGWDDYPISTYPMFARGDLGSVVDLDHVLVVFGDGEASPAPPVTLGTPEVMVAMKVISGAIARGEAADLCRRVARSELLPRREGRLPSEVSVVTSRFDARRYFTDGASRGPLSRTVHARCVTGGLP